MPKELEARLQKIEQEARHIFGDAHAEHWLRKPSRFFKGKSPLEFASELEKADAVLKHVSYFGQARV